MSGRGSVIATAKKQAVSRSHKASLVFPVGRVACLLRKGRYSERVSATAPVYVAAVLEYLAAEVLELAGHVCRESRKKKIMPRHIYLATQNDPELGKLLEGVTITRGGVVPHIHTQLLPLARCVGQLKQSL
ncbi:unnamed protein product [Calypogeia fissa]